MTSSPRSRDYARSRHPTDPARSATTTDATPLASACPQPRRDTSPRTTPTPQHRPTNSFATPPTTKASSTNSTAAPPTPPGSDRWIKAKALEARASELATLADSELVQRISEANLDAIRQRVRAALDDGGPMRVKAILQDLTEEIRVDARDAIEPTFVLPAVRPPSGSMDLIGVLSNHDLQGSLGRLAGKLAAVRASGGPRRPVVACRQRPRRPGWVLKAVVQVLADRDEPMRARDIHAVVEASHGEPVRRASVKAALAANVLGASPRFVRVARGRYVLAGRPARLLVGSTTREAAPQRSDS